MKKTDSQSSKTQAMPATAALQANPKPCYHSILTYINMFQTCSKIESTCFQMFSNQSLVVTPHRDKPWVACEAPNLPVLRMFLLGGFRWIPHAWLPCGGASTSVRLFCYLHHLASASSPHVYCRNKGYVSKRKQHYEVVVTFHIRDCFCGWCHW